MEQKTTKAGETRQESDCELISRIDKVITARTSERYEEWTIKFSAKNRKDGQLGGLG